MLIHPTLELSLVLVVISTLFVASSSIIVHAGNKSSCDCDTVNKGSMNYKFAVAVLVVAVLVLVYGLSFLGLHLYDKYM